MPREEKVNGKWRPCSKPDDQITDGLTDGTAKYRYPLDVVLKWYVNKYSLRSKLARSQEPLDEEAALLLSESDSPAMERYRTARAALAELDLEERRGDVVRVAEMRAVLLRLAGPIKVAGDALKIQFGTVAVDILERALDEFMRIVEDELGPESDAVVAGENGNAEGEAVPAVGGGGDNSSPRSEAGEVSTRESPSESDLGSRD
jgi:hypothetical protein